MRFSQHWLWVLSSRIHHHVVHRMSTSILEERIATIFSVLGDVFLKTLFQFQWPTWHYITEDKTIQSCVTNRNIQSFITNESILFVLLYFVPTQCHYSYLHSDLNHYLQINLCLLSTGDEKTWPKEWQVLQHRFHINKNYLAFAFYIEMLWMYTNSEESSLSSCFFFWFITDVAASWKIVN